MYFCLKDFFRSVYSALNSNQVPSKTLPPPETFPLGTCPLGYSFPTSYSQNTKSCQWPESLCTGSFSS